MLRVELTRGNGDMSQTNPAMTYLAGLVGAETCLRLVFPDEATRPCLRYFRELQRKRLLPFKKIGRRTFFDPVEVRRALDRQFSVHPR